ncbi:serine/threonine protein kinase [Mortierella sp. GBA35]|nr:serine/threonine protein kinase [Mortierella sp. GBA35]
MAENPSIVANGPEGMRIPKGAPPSAIPSHMLVVQHSPTGSETTVVPDAEECNDLLALDDNNIPHATPEVNTPDIATLRQYMESHGDVRSVSPPSFRLPSPASPITAPLHPDISTPLSPGSPVNSSPPLPPGQEHYLGTNPSINGAVANSHPVSSNPAPPVPADINIRDFQESSQPTIYAPEQTLDHTTVQPHPPSAYQAPGYEPSSSASLGVPVKRTLPISPLAQQSASYQEEDDGNATAITSDAPEQQRQERSNQAYAQSVEDPKYSPTVPMVKVESPQEGSAPVDTNGTSPHQGSSDMKPQSMGAGRRSRAVISEMSPVEIDEVLDDAATRLVAARHDAGDEHTSDSEPSATQTPAVVLNAPTDYMGVQGQPTPYTLHYFPTPSYLHGSHLSRTSSDSTDVLISHPVSMENSRHNSDDEDFGHHPHQHQGHAGQHNDPSSNGEWTQRRQQAAANQPPFNLQQHPQPNPGQPQLQQQQQPQQPTSQGPPPQTANVRQVTDDFQRQQLNDRLVNAAPSTPGPSSSQAAVAPATVTARLPTPMTPVPIRQSSGIGSFKLRDRDGDSIQNSPRKSARETSHGIFHDLKRFFNVGSGSSPHVSPVGASPSPGHTDSNTPPPLKSKKSGLLGEWTTGGSGSGTDSPRGALGHGNAIETDLRKKYGKLGKVLGRGAGGTVRILSRSSDQKVFAIKQFRKRRPNESERSYVKKVTSEYCLGSTFHHPNIIETLDIVKESNNYYEVMEFAKYELFSAVMSGLMGREEIACCFRGIVDGVAYLHGLGVAHRDLKLDNCVMNERGIVKIIDFGCSMVYQLPFEKKIQMAKGVSGSDPYIAPELFTTEQHDPRLADVWSMGIIFLCMTLRRFPWRIPKAEQDSSFHAFAKPDGTGKLRLLKLMPRESRPIMSRILEMDPRKRVLISDILEDSWMKNLDHCTIGYMSLNHPHHLGDDGTVVSNPNEGFAVLPPSIHGSENGRSQEAPGSHRSHLAITPAAV